MNFHKFFVISPEYKYVYTVLQLSLQVNHGPKLCFLVLIEN